jgi:biopolymer transport protein ExbB
MFMSADIIVKAVMIGLMFASVLTWTIWLAKTLACTGAFMSAWREKHEAAVAKSWSGFWGSRFARRLGLG